MQRTWVVAIAAIVVIVVMVANLSSLGPDAAATSTPSLAALPTLRPTAATAEPVPTARADPTVEPSSVAGCKVAQLALAAGGWGGATGSMAGTATLVNVSSDPCRVGGSPAVELRDANDRVIASGDAERGGAPVVIVPGDVAGATLVWRNWCADPPSTPLSVRVVVASGVSVTARVTDWFGAVGGSEADLLPRCDAATAPSTIAANAFALPDAPDTTGDEPACVSTDLAGFLGGWGAAAGTSYASATIFNQAGDGCVLQASPPLELRDAAGRIVARGEAWPDAGTIVVPSGSAAQTFIGFADWCGAKPKLPFAFGVRIGGALLTLRPTSRSSEIGVPACQSDPPSKEPNLVYNGPFALPPR